MKTLSSKFINTVSSTNNQESSVNKVSTTTIANSNQPQGDKMKTLSVKADPNDKIRKILKWIPVLTLPTKQGDSMKVNYGSFSKQAVFKEFLNMQEACPELKGTKEYTFEYFRLAFSEFMYMLSKANNYREIGAIKSQYHEIYPYFLIAKPEGKPEDKNSDIRFSGTDEEYEEYKKSLEAKEEEEVETVTAEDFFDVEDAAESSIFNIAIGMRINAMKALDEACEEARYDMHHAYVEYMEANAELFEEFTNVDKALDMGKAFDRAFRYLNKADINSIVGAEVFDERVEAEEQTRILNNFKGLSAVEVYVQDLILTADEESDLAFAAYINEQRKGSNKISISNDEAETFANPEASANPVEEHGILETLIRRFTDGIQYGTTFDKTWRNSQFEEGFNAQDVWHADHSTMGPDYQGHILDAKERNYAKKLVENMEGFSDSQETRLVVADRAYDDIMEACKAKIDAGFASCNSLEEAEGIFNKNSKGQMPIVAMLNAATAEFMPKYHKMQTGEVLKTKYNMPFPNMKIVSLEEQAYDLDVINKIMEEAKTPNQMILAELASYARAQIVEAFDCSMQIELHDKIVQTVERALVAFDSTREAANAIKGKLNRNEVSVVVKFAKLNNKYRFERDVYMTLLMAGLVGTKRSVDVQTADLIKTLQNGGEVNDLTVEQARKILSAAASDEQYKLPYSVWRDLKDFTTAA